MKVAGTGVCERAAARLPYALAACFALASTMMTTFPVISPNVVSELYLSYGQAGIITGAYLLGYGLFQIPASFIGVRFGAGRVLIGAALMMSVAAVIPCLFDNVNGWLVGRFMMGIGGAAVLPLSIRLLVVAMPRPRFVKGLGIFISGWGIGMTVAMVGAAPVLDILGWRPVMVMSALLGLLVTTCLQWALPWRDNGARAGDLTGISVGTAVKELSRNYTLSMMGVVNVAGTSTTVCLLAWLPLFLARAFGLSAAQTSAWLSPIGIAVALGAWAGGALTIRCGWRVVVVGSLLVSAVLIAAIPFQSSSLPVVILTMMTGGIAMMFAAPLQSLFSSIVPETWTGLAAGYYNTFGFIGAFSASLAFGALLDLTSSFTVGWISLVALIGVGVFAAFLLPIPRRSNRNASDLGSETSSDVSPENSSIFG